MPKHLRRYLSSVILLALISVFSSAALSTQEPVRELTILHTNDFHSAFDPIPASRPSPGRLVPSTLQKRAEGASRSAR